MAPIVHGLEKEWTGRVDFLYLDIADSVNQAAKAHLGFRATPHFFMLNREGLIRGEWQGVVERDTLVRALDSIVRESQRANPSNGGSGPTE